MDEITFTKTEAKAIGAAFTALGKAEDDLLDTVVGKYDAAGKLLAAKLPAKGDRERGWFVALQKGLADQGVTLADARVSRSIAIAERPADRTLADYRTKCAALERPITPTVTGFVGYVGGKDPQSATPFVPPPAGVARNTAAAEKLEKVFETYKLSDADIVAVLRDLLAKHNVTVVDEAKVAKKAAKKAAKAAAKAA